MVIYRCEPWDEVVVALYRDLAGRLGQLLNVAFDLIEAVAGERRGLIGDFLVVEIGGLVRVYGERSAYRLLYGEGVFDAAEVGGEVVVLVNVDEKRALFGGYGAGEAFEGRALVGYGGDRNGLTFRVGGFFGINFYGAAFRRGDVYGVAGIDELHAKLHIPGRGDDEGVVKVDALVVGELHEGVALVGDGGEGNDVAGIVVVFYGGNGDAAVFRGSDGQGVGAGYRAKGSERYDGRDDQGGEFFHDGIALFGGDSKCILLFYHYYNRRIKKRSASCAPLGLIYKISVL